MNETRPAVRRLRDPRELDALAHPVRVGILEQLTIGGPMTATALADLLGETPANCSWHLRKLAARGFVVEAEGGRGRQRPWQVAEVGLSWDGDDASPEERRAGHALGQMMLERWLDRFITSMKRSDDDEPQWQRARSMGEAVTWLTAEELAEVNEAMTQLMFRHHERIEDPSARPEGARLCELVAWGVPVELGPGSDR